MAVLGRHTIIVGFDSHTSRGAVHAKVLWLKPWLVRT